MVAKEVGIEEGRWAIVVGKREAPAKAPWPDLFSAVKIAAHRNACLAGKGTRSHEPLLRGLAGRALQIIRLLQFARFRSIP